MEYYWRALSRVYWSGEQFPRVVEQELASDQRRLSTLSSYEHQADEAANDTLARAAKHGYLASRRFFG